MDERIKVAHSVNPYLPRTASWIYSQIVNLKRYEPLVITKKKANIQIFPFENVHAVFSLPPLRRGYERLYKKLTRRPFPLFVKVLAENKVPILHSHFCQHGMEDAKMKKILDIRHITMFYGTDIWSRSRVPAWREGFGRFVRESDLFLVEGNAMREKAISLGAEGDKVKVFHLGVDLNKIEFQERSPENDGTMRILMAGRAVEKKGFVYGLKAFAMLAGKYPNIRLEMIIGGSSPVSVRIKKEMRDFVAEKGLGSRIEWVEFLPYGQYLQRIKRAHILLQPSVIASDGDAEGGFPVTIIELSASGMPVVATRHCDIPEAVMDGKTGLIAEERDINGLAERLEYLITKPELWPEFGRAGREHVASEYNIEIQAGRLEDIYDQVLA